MSDAITVTGGVGGTRARLEDLMRCAAVLDTAATHLDALGRPLAGLRATVDAAARVSPTTAGRARVAVETLGSSRGGVPGLAWRARDTAERLRRAARAYADADAAVAGLLRRWAVTAAHTLGEAGPAAWAGAAVVAAPAAMVGAGALQRLAAVRALARTPTPAGLALRGAGVVAEHRGGLAGRLLGGPGLLPDLGRPSTRVLDPVTAVLAAFVVGAAPGRRPVPGGLAPWAGGPSRGVQPAPVREAARLLTVPGVLADRVLHGPSTLVVTPQPVVRDRARGAEAPGDAADLVAGIADVYPQQGAPPGTVAVHRLAQPSGEVSWVVTVPGTQSGSLVGGPNPADMGTNLALMAGYDDDVRRLVGEAMDRSGIRPGEPVQLVGHSQGGIAAAALASDPAVLDRYDVRGVLTVGSPVAGIELPEGVVGLHLETARDGVAATDGAWVPDRPNQTFVTVDLSRAEDPALRAAGLTWSGEHAVDTYAAVARDVVRLEDPSVAHATGVIADVLGGPGTTVTTAWFTGTRVPLDRPVDATVPPAPGPTGAR